MKKEKLLIKINDSELGRFEIDTFVYKASRKSPAVFISPVFGGAPFIEHILGRMFAMNGFHAFITDFMPVRKCLMYIATKDEHVPTSCQIQT